MKYWICFLMFFIGTCNIDGQNAIDTVKFRIIYNSTYKETIESDVENDLTVLEIGNKFSKFYSRYRHDLNLYSDSLKKKGVDDFTRIQILYGGDNRNNGARYQVFKNYPTNGKLTYTYVIFNFPYLYEEDLPEMNWRLVEGDSIVSGYACKKAVGELRGRVWTVWYTLDLPYNDGPWKLCGLPGLILDAEENDGLFAFHFAGIERYSYPLSFPHKKRYERCTPKQLQDSLYDFWENQSGFAIRKATGLSVDRAENERAFKPCLMEYYK